MPKPIKSPIGEVVEPCAYWNLGEEYMTEEAAQFQYRIYICKFLDVGLEPYSFADWLEAQGVKLV